MWGNTVTIHNVLKKITTKLNSQPAQYEKNKIDKDNSRKKKNIIKKIMWGKHCSNLFHEKIYSCNS
jgi:hypothetical protein